MQIAERGHQRGAGGILGRPVKLVYYDDQSNTLDRPGLTQKLLTSTRWTS